MTEHTDELFKIMEEMRLAKKKLEVDLTSLINVELGKFTQNTGLRVVSVDVRMNTFSEESTAYLATEVYCGITV
jgi:hypothetical protein